MHDLCEDHHCALFANMDDLNWTVKRNLGISHINMTRKRSTFKWFERAFIITKVELISILPLFPQSKLIGQIKYKKRPLQELSIGVWVDFGQILAPKWVPRNLGLTVLYMRPIPTPLSCVWQYFGQFWEKNQS
jgi:hypothetical protein